MTIFFKNIESKKIMKTKEVKKEKTVQKLKTFLSEEKEIVFAYLHGSFLNEDEFNDVDIVLYLDEKILKKINPVDFEISLSLRLEKYLKVPVDVKILNCAPLSFRYHATRRYLLFSRDDLIREEFLVRTWGEYFDFKPVSKIYLRETFFA